VPISFFNLALLTGSGLSAEALRARGREACAWAAAQSVPWLFMVTHERLESGVDAAATLDACGLAVVMPMTGMLTGSVAAAPAIPGLQLTVPPDDSGCATILDINSLAYGMDLEAGKATVGSRAFWKDQFPVVGAVDGKPVTSAAVLMVDGHRYVALVATDPGYQRRGFGDATMRRALENAAKAHGEKPTVLHATDAGRPVYERMGYKSISTHTLFMEKRFLEEH
jgi:GNAT superfamily N-acetyltransferase